LWMRPDSQAAHDAFAPIVRRGLWGATMDLVEGFVGLVALILLFAYLGRIAHRLEALEKRERGH
jgi:hypothetical protein